MEHSQSRKPKLDASPSERDGTKLESVPTLLPVTPMTLSASLPIPKPSQRDNVRPRPAPPLPIGTMLPGSAPNPQAAKLDRHYRPERTDALHPVDYNNLQQQQPPDKKPKLQTSNSESSLPVVRVADCSSSPSTKITPSPTPTAQECKDSSSSVPVKLNRRVQPERSNADARPPSPPRSSLLSSSSSSSSLSPSKVDDLSSRQHIYKPKVDATLTAAAAATTAGSSSSGSSADVLGDQKGDAQQTRRETTNKPGTNSIKENDAQRKPNHFINNGDNPDDMQIESDSSNCCVDDDNSNSNDTKNAKQHPLPRSQLSLEVLMFRGRHLELRSLLGDVFGEPSVDFLMNRLAEALEEGSSGSRRKAKARGLGSRIIERLKHHYENVTSTPDESQFSALFVKAYAEDVFVTMPQVRNYFRQKRVYENRTKTRKQQQQDAVKT